MRFLVRPRLTLIRAGALSRRIVTFPRADNARPYCCRRAASPRNAFPQPSTPPRGGARQKTIKQKRNLCSVATLRFAPLFLVTDKCHRRLCRRWKRNINRFPFLGSATRRFSPRLRKTKKSRPFFSFHQPIRTVSPIPNRCSYGTLSRFGHQRSHLICCY